MVAGTLGSFDKVGSTKMTQTSTLTAGIDTSKAKLDIAIDGKPERWQVANASKGWHELVAVLKEAGVTRIGIEATGGYERGVVRHLRAEGFVVLVLQPMQVRAVAQLRLRRAKNDAIDATLIAACATMMEPHELEPDARLAELSDRLTYVEQLEEDIARWKTRHEHTPGSLRADVEARLKALKKAASEQLKLIMSALRNHADLRLRFDLVHSVRGIGERTAVAIVVRVPELGRVTREQVAALAGLAPFDCDSGRYKGQRHIAGGRARLRRALYAAALPAAFRWNDALIALYDRLTNAGKPHKAALVACARKLLIYANTVVARETPWVERSAAA
jgi:transposase